MMLAKIKQISDSAYNFKEALHQATLSQDDVDCFRKMVDLQEAVPKTILDKQLLPFLVACDNDKEKASKLIGNHYKIKRDSPEFFQNRDVKSAEVQTSLSNQDYVILPPTPDKCNLILFRLSSYEPSDYDFDHAAKTYIMTFETAIFKHGPQDGMICLIDMKGSRFGHLFRPGISSMRKGLRLLQDGCPVKLKAIHVLNTFPFVNMIMSMIRPFTSTGFLSKIHWHASEMDYEKFYNEHIPKSCLPSDYGGDLESVEILHNKNKQILMDMEEYFYLEELQMNFEF